MKKETKRIAVTGPHGIMGNKLVMSYQCIPIYSDVTKFEDLNKEINDIKPNVLIHCAAVNDVDYCESNFKKTLDVNIQGTFNAIESMPENSLFIYISTIHIFSGGTDFPKGYSEDDNPSPINNYGFSKLGGELATKTGKCRTVIIRCSNLINYIWAEPVISKLKKNESVFYALSESRSFYHTDHAIDSILYIINHLDKYPDLYLVNIAGKEIFSYYEFWVRLKNYLNLLGEVKPYFGRWKNKAARPMMGGLDISRAKEIGIPIHTLEEGFELIRQGI